MKKVLKNIFLTSAGAFKSPVSGVHIFNSHEISRQEGRAEIFHDLLNKLNRQVTFIGFEEAVTLISSRKKVNDVLVAFSYDDGFEECYSKIAPVLEDFKTNAAFFINPGFIDGDAAYRLDFTENKVLHPGKTPMSWNMCISLLNRGHIIGAHTIDHIRLDTGDTDILETQIKGCRTYLEKKLNTDIVHFAYPYGQQMDLSSEALRIALDSYKYIYTGCNYKAYFTWNERVINRRHIEGDWPLNHVRYFLSSDKTYYINKN